jgi:hypothetical protein
MAKTSIGRRLSAPPVLAPAPVVPAPKPAPMPGAIAAAQNPQAGGIVTQTPAPAPGMLPQTAVPALFDATAMPAAAAAEPADGGGWQGTLQRALIGFNKGASRVAVDPTYNPIAAGIVGGVASIGAEQESAVNRKLAAQAAAQKPFADAQAEALKVSLAEKAREPFKLKEQQDTLNRELELAKEKAKLGQTPEEIEATARNLVGVPPSMWSQLLGRTSHSRAAIFNRVAELQGKTPQEVEAGYQIGKSAGIASAGFNAAGKGQQTARAANSVKILLPGLAKASEEFMRSNLPLANQAISALDVNAGGTKAIALKQYLTDTKLKMASALMQGGVPTDQATNIINNAFPDGLSAAQMKEAIHNISDIMDTQIKGGLTPVALTPAGEAPATPGAAPAPVAPAWAGGPVHTYPDGTKAQFVNGKWVKVP